MLSTRTLTVKSVGDRDLLIVRDFDAPRTLVFEASPLRLAQGR